MNIIWAALKSQLGLSAEDIAACNAENQELHGKVSAANIAAAYQGPPRLYGGTG